MTFPRSLARTAGFAALYLVAAYAGRMTVIGETNLSLIWPAGGVLAVWFVAQRGSRWQWLDVLALAGITMLVNTATGASPALAGFFVAANLAMAYSFVFLLGRWIPGLWTGSGRGQPLSQLSELWRLIAVAVISTGCGALIGPTGVWLVTGHYSWPGALIWLTHNTVSILLVGVALRRIGYLLRHWRTERWEVGEAPPWWPHQVAAGRLEYLALIGASTIAYLLVFDVNRELPVAFALIAMTVWAGLRMHTTFVVLHDLAFGTATVLFTLHGKGPFAMIESQPARTLVAQLFVGTVAVVGLALALSRDERDSLTTQLRDQAELLATIVESVSEGIGVVDEHGRFLMRNAAAARLLGGVTSASGSIQAGGYYGLHYADGTPIPEDQLPYRRALTGQHTEPIDILVRNRGLPDGRIVSLNSAVLPHPINGVRHVVIAFHDVTADRRHRDELANFAGVVAHDLLNPLATIDGWCETLNQDLDDPHDTIGAGLTRIRRAAARMGTLINDLLAYTTARDAALAATRTDLAAILDDIITGRIDHAVSSGLPVPVFRIHDLPYVAGDAVLIRQLLENLIGNAIKYTPPGVTPVITITASHREASMTRIDIDDNGIGIPDGQHDAIFGNFHRAHRDAGYAGTGLGLAICKRIVERHGGTITATDNPAGQGTRISLTLPSAERETRAAA